MFRKLILVAAIACCMTGTAFAQELKLDLSKLPPDLSAQILAAQQRLNAKAEATPAIPTASQAQQWADVGQNLAAGVSATAKALSMEANEFIKTPVGWWTFIFIFWYFLGAKLWAIVGGTLTWIALTWLIWRSFRTFHMPQKQLVSENTETHEKKYEYVRYQFSDDTDRNNKVICPGKSSSRTCSAVAHAIFFTVVSVAMISIIF